MISMSALHEPGLYTKGDLVKVASTPADAVALVFDGFTLSESSSPEALTEDEVGQDADNGAGEPVDPESDPDQPQGEPVDAPVQPGQSRSFDF